MLSSNTFITAALVGWISLALAGAAPAAAAESAPASSSGAPQAAPTGTVAQPAASPAESTAGLPPDVFAKSRWTEVTRADWDHALAKLPESMRWEFATSPKRVQDMLNNLLYIKTLAAQARADGVTPSEADARPRPGSPDKGPIDPDRALANAELRHIDDASVKAFDADKAGFEKKAREIYTVDRDKYKLPEQRVFSDIAVSIKLHGDDGAKARAAEARAKLLAGGDWNAITREYSDDPGTKDKGGVLPPMSDSELPPTIAKGLLALKKPGDISEPLKTEVAWHIARLDAIHPPRTQTFDEVKDSIMATLRARYVAGQRNLRFDEINRDPTLKINQKAIDALVNRVDASGKPIPPAPVSAAPAAPAPDSPSPAEPAPQKPVAK